MIQSMTGFGRGSVASPRTRYTVEIKSLNSKQLDLMMRVPSALRELEIDIRNRVAATMQRGKADLSVTTESLGAETTAHVNVAALKAYRDQISEAAGTLGLPEPQDWYSVLMRLPDVMRSEAPATDEDDRRVVMQALEEAIAALCEFRLQEGRKLYRFFISKIEAIRELLESVAPYESERVPAVRARLEEQLGRLTSIEYDRGRLEQELIFYIEKLDITEEKLRLTSHLNYFIETLGTETELPASGQGKKLGFIAQEMGREINTLGSKANHAQMQQIVVKMKDELEQIKEQVLNVL